MPRISEIARIADTVPPSQITERIGIEARRLVDATAGRVFEDQVFATVMLLVLAGRQLREVLEVKLAENSD